MATGFGTGTKASAPAASSITLSVLVEEIDGIVQDRGVYTPAVIAGHINRAQSAIAGGIKMPDGSISPPLPGLADYNTVATTAQAYALLPSRYQRNVFKVLDNSGVMIPPPRGGDYYAYILFLKQISDLRFTEPGSIYKVAVKGARLYYQGIPAASENLGVHFYRKPADMVLDSDTPDGIPEHLQSRLIRHYVLKEIFGEAIEDGQDNTGIATKYHTEKFYEAMTELAGFTGIDAGPQYYGSGGFEDWGACDG